MKTTGFLSEMDRYLFGHGTHYEIYKKLGSHPGRLNGKSGVFFAVWAPNAKSVSLVGNFNNWDITSDVMTRSDDSGIFEIFCQSAKPGEIYKYAIKTPDDRIIYKADPYANSSELKPGTASIITDCSKFHWSDKRWLNKRIKQNYTQAPIAIYELHPGSWKKHRDEHGSWYFTYREIAADLVSYVQDMGYTHVELIGIPEHLSDVNYGKMVTGYFAPNSRYGSPEDFAYLVNTLHNNNIGVILNWTPAYFALDSHGLINFDGDHVYEYADTLKRDVPEYSARAFDLGRNQVSNFLISNAMFWVEQFHIDGLHADSLSSMLYLDYGMKNKKHAVNNKGGIENLDAVEFFRHLNSMMQKRNPGVLMIADESTCWPGLTDSVEQNGLGFTFRWNIKWMNQFLDYLKYDPYFRQFNHESMISEATARNMTPSILPLPHTAVTTLKGSLYQQIFGEDANKISTLKVAYTYFIGHPGKKLIFMGQDFGQNSSWEKDKQIDWFLQYTSRHRNLQNFTRDLLSVYRTFDCLSDDRLPLKSFKWINTSDNKRSIYSFVRTSEKAGNNLLFILNFTPVSYPDYAVGVPVNGKYKLIMDETRGLITKPEKNDTYTVVSEICDKLPYRLNYPLPAFGVAMFKY